MNSKFVKIATVLALTSSIFFACKSSKIYDVPSAVRPFAGKAPLAPPGMVYIPAGTIFERGAVNDSLTADTTSRRVSLSAFFIDETEVSNKQYRKFVDWVADSVAVNMLKDPKYFYNAKIKSKNKSVKDSTAKRINWGKIDINGKVPFWQANSEKLSGLVSIQNGKKILNRDKATFTYAHVQAGGPNAGKTVTDTVKVVPDNNVWAEDFPNSQSDFLVNNYFSIKGFDNYPVVGVTWKQARAYSSWRGIISGSLDDNLRDLGVTFTLPTEAQWEYAGSGGEKNAENAEGVVETTSKNVIPSYIDKKTKKNLPIANFKQGEGDYTRDGSIQTVPVKSYAPNVFGLYNMQGNVSEWTLDAYSPSAREFVADRDPALLLDVPDSDADVMKRKAVKGGSWKDNAHDLNTTTRNYEVQDGAHSYIGFRCVMSAPEVITNQLKTRTIIIAKKSKKAAKLTASAN